MSTQLPEDAENWGRGGGQSVHGRAPIRRHHCRWEEEDKEQVVIESVMEEELEQPMAGEPLTREPDEDTIDTISQDVMPIHAGEADVQ